MRLLCVTACHSSVQGSDPSTASAWGSEAVPPAGHSRFLVDTAAAHAQAQSRTAAWARQLLADVTAALCDVFISLGRTIVPYYLSLPGDLGARGLHLLTLLVQPAHPATPLLPRPSGQCGVQDATCLLPAAFVLGHQDLLWRLASFHSGDVVVPRASVQLNMGAAGRSATLSRCGHAEASLCTAVAARWQSTWPADDEPECADLWSFHTTATTSGPSRVGELALAGALVTAGLRDGSDMVAQAAHASGRLLHADAAVGWDAWDAAYGAHRSVRVATHALSWVLARVEDAGKRRVCCPSAAVAVAACTLCPKRILCGASCRQ